MTLSNIDSSSALASISLNGLIQVVSHDGWSRMAGGAVNATPMQPIDDDAKLLPCALITKPSLKTS